MVPSGGLNILSISTTNMNSAVELIPKEYRSKSSSRPLSSNSSDSIAVEKEMGNAMARTEEEAFKTFRMISPREENVRMVAGGGLFVISLDRKSVV